MRVEKPFIFEKVKQIRSISCGYGYTLMVDIWGKVWSIGFNNQGQLGLGHCNSNEQNE